MEYWPWWIGALALGGITVLFRLLLGRPLGISGSWARIVDWKETQKQTQSAKMLNENSHATSSALMAETLAEFGEHALDKENPPNQLESSVTTPTIQTTPVIADVAFLVSMFAGALFVAITSGDFHIQYQLSDLHIKLSGHSQIQSWITLFIGGLLVGIGTQMGSGCSSGHGLSGCAQLSKASLKATATFFTTAVIVSLFIKMAFGL